MYSEHDSLITRHKITLEGVDISIKSITDSYDRTDTPHILKLYIDLYIIMYGNLTIIVFLILSKLKV